MIDIYSMCSNTIQSYKDTRKGRKVKQTPIDLFFMLLVTLKYFCRWYVTSTLFDIRRDTFKKNYHVCKPHV